MEAGGKDRPPMLEPSNYVQWKSRIKRYIDTKPNNKLIHYCLQDPPYKFKWTKKTIPVAEGISETTTKGYLENYKNMSQDIRNQLDADAKALFLNNNLRTSLNTSRAHHDNTLRIKRGTEYDNQRVVNVAGARENVEQAVWRDNTDDEPEDQELEAHYLEHLEQPESVNDTYLEEQGDTNIVIDSLDMSTNGEHPGQPESKMSHTLAKNENSKESFNKHRTLLERRMDESIPWDQKCKSSKELFKIKSRVDIIFDGVERCKQTISKRTHFGHIDPFIKNRIEGNFYPQIRNINADLEEFHLCLKEEMVADLRYFNSLENEVDSLKS
ncbi:hypothetical protein Tco_0517208 [Tanacetum coccineum]